MKMDFWKNYDIYMTGLAAHLPSQLVSFGDVVFKILPVLFAVSILLKSLRHFVDGFNRLMDSIQTLLLHPLVRMAQQIVYRLHRGIWTSAFSEPEHKGIITEAPVYVQKWFHAFAAILTGVFAVFFLFIMVIAFYPIFSNNIIPEHYIKGVVTLFLIGSMSFYFSMLQVGVCHQSIKLYKSLSN